MGQNPHGWPTCIVCAAYAAMPLLGATWPNAVRNVAHGLRTSPPTRRTERARHFLWPDGGAQNAWRITDVDSRQLFGQWEDVQGGSSMYQGPPARQGPEP
jgi:hypothetical protein